MRRQGRRKDIRGCRALNASLCQVSTGAEDVLSPPGVESSRWVVTALPYNTVCTFSLTVLVSGLNLDVARLPPPAACGLPPAAGRRSAGFIPQRRCCAHTTWIGNPRTLPAGGSQPRPNPCRWWARPRARSQWRLRTTCDASGSRTASYSTLPPTRARRGGSGYW